MSCPREIPLSASPHPQFFVNASSGKLKRSLDDLYFSLRSSRFNRSRAILLLIVFIKRSGSPEGPKDRKYYYSDIFNSLFLQKFLYQRRLIIRNFYCQVYHSWNWTLNRFRNSLQRLERLALNSLKNLILLSQTFLFPIYRAFIQVLNKPEYSISKMSLGDSILKSRSTRNSKKRRNRRNWSCNFDENSGSPWRVWSIVGRKKE